MKPNPVVWFEIYVSDMERAKRFYETVFQTKLEPLPAGPEIEMWAFPMKMAGEGAAGAICRMPGFEGGGGNVIIYFTSEDCSIEEKRVVAAGGKIQKSKMSIGDYGFISLAVDTEGNMIGIHSRA